MTGVICFRLNSDSDEEENSTCILKPGAQCYAEAKERFQPNGTRELVYSAGCLPPDEQSLLQCKGDLAPHYRWRTIECCNFTDLCNKNLLEQIKPRDTLKPPDFAIQDLYLFPFVYFAIFFVISILCVVAFFFCRRKKSHGECLPVFCSEKVERIGNRVYDYSSGSGDGRALLVRRTIGRMVSDELLLSKGRFNDKYVVRLKGDRVVMKKFYTLQEEYWLQEKKVYETKVCGENILHVIGFDILGNGTFVTLTYYHENGSLYDYLRQRCLNDDEFLTLARSAVFAVTCLHTEVYGTNKRPSIVHRNITSKNFLISNKRECVICDFEVALTFPDNEITNSEKNKIDLRAGTPRYMAPEVINESINIQIEAFKWADVYSLGLVFWEMFRRYATIAEDYALPFDDMLGREDPTVEDMKDLFTLKKPISDILGIPVTREKDKISHTVTKLIRECISEKGDARPTPLRIQKGLTTFGEN